MEKRYRLVLQKLVTREEDFADRLVKAGVQRQTANEIIGLIPVVVKTGLSLGQARRYADALQEAGAKVLIEDSGTGEARQKANNGSILPLKAFVVCPRCGMKQPRAVNCARCGLKLGSVQGGRGVPNN